MSSTEKVVIKTLNKPAKEDPDEAWVWFCAVFDLSSKNNELEPELLKEIAGGSIKGSGITSKALNAKFEMPRSTVIYHLNRFISSGLVIRKGRKYYLRSNDMASTIEELQADMLREFQRLTEFAEQVDRMMEGDILGRREKRKREEK